jgi:hypothetical protein
MAWISEIHYLNTYASSSGVAEYVEITLTPAEFARANDFQFATYQTTGETSTVVSLSTLTPVIDPNNGYYVYTITVPTTDPDALGTGNEAEAMALVDNSLASPVLQFFDIGGGTTAITATDGPAAGQTSTNIPAAPARDGNSIQFTKTGTRIDGVLTPGGSTICFCDGTLIETGEGMRPVEDLSAGDRVRNFAGEFIALKWIGGRVINGADLARNPKLYPVRIMAGALGKGLPQRDLLVSRQHRILIDSKIAERVTGRREVLVAAIKLTELPGVFVDTTVTQVRYFHLLFDRHEIIFAEGAASESLFTGPEALNAVSPEAREEILGLFPGLNTSAARTSARFIPVGKLQKRIIARHAKNDQPLQVMI